MNLGLGLAAADSYYKADDARKEREYEQAKRDAELSSLGDVTQERRTTAQLRSKQNNANMGLVDAQTDLAKKDLAGKAERQPYENRAGLAQAQSKAMGAEADLANLPDKIEMAATQGVLDHQGQSDMVIGTMGQLISRNDKAGALDFANKIAAKGNILPNTNGKSFTDIQPVKGGPEGDGYNFVTSDGDTKFVPAQAIAGAMQKLKSGKYHFIHTADGSVYSGNENTGAVTQAHKGDPKVLRGQHTPADIQSTEWLMANVPKFKGNPESAWEAVRSSREKTRNSFIMDYVAKNALPGADTNKMADDAGKIYDQLRQNQGPVTPAPSNNGQQGTLGSGSYDPRINSLIGVPSQ